LFANCPDCFDTQPAADLVDQPIQLIVYPTGSNAQYSFASQFDISSNLSSAAFVVPSTTAMNEVVLSDPAAFGFLPEFAIDDALAKVSLTDSGETYSVTLPLLAIATEEPPTPIRLWLACIQEKLNS
jgi:hypothetical protein